MQKKILYLQFRTEAESYELERAAFREKMALYPELKFEVRFLDVFDKETKKELAAPETLLRDYSGVIFGGSAEFYFGGNISDEQEDKHRAMLERIGPLVRYIFSSDFPALGICFGHQMFGHFLGTRVVADAAQAETGSYPIALTEAGAKDPLFKELSDRFLAFFIHRDSLEYLPEGAVLLALGARSQVAAFRYKTNIYGLQFHPELDKHDMPPRLKSHPEYLEHSWEEDQELFQSTPYASRLLFNFIERLA